MDEPAYRTSASPGSVAVRAKVQQLSGAIAQKPSLVSIRLAVDDVQPFRMNPSEVIPN